MRLRISGAFCVPQLFFQLLRRASDTALMRDRAEDVLLMRRIALAMLGVGSAVCALGVVSKPLAPTAAACQGAVAAAFALWFSAVALSRPRRGVLELAALSSIVQLGVIMATSNVVGTTPFFFLWPCVYLAFISARRVARDAIGLVAVTAPICCAANPYLADRLDTAIGTVASVGLMGWLVMAMNERARTLSHALETAANTDPLTGLLNRRGLEPQLRALSDAARETATPLSVVAVDIDHFKRFNDAHGHAGGEFVVVLPGRGSVGALAYGERLRDHLRRLPVTTGEAITVSVGTATATATATADVDVATPAVLLRAADAALCASKQGGRNRVTRWSDGLPTQLPSRRTGSRSPAAAGSTS